MTDDNYRELDFFTEWKVIQAKGTIFTPRTGHALAQVNNKIWLFGGSDTDVFLNNTISYHELSHC